MQHTEFTRRAEELWQRSDAQNIVTHSNFLTPAEQHSLAGLSHIQSSLHLFGGLAESERRVAFFLPDYLTHEDFDPSAYITAFHLRCRFGVFGHRDVLGSLLGLGLARWSIGDIYTKDEDAWFFCLPSVANAIARDLTKIGRNGVQITEIPLYEVPEPERQREEIRFTVSSCRLDAIVSGTWNLSRTNAANLIESGLVSLNYTVCERTSATVEAGDVFSLRGYGKAALRELGGKSRKDRIHLIVERYS